MGAIGAAVAGLNGLGAALKSAAKNYSETAAHVEKETVRIKRAITEQSASLSSGLRMFEEFARSGNEWAQRATSLFVAVEEGALSAGQVVHAFGDALVETENGMRTFRDVASGLGLDQLAIQLREVIKESKTYEERVEILNTLQGDQARGLAAIIAAFERGEATIDEVLEKLSEAKRAAGATGDLAQGLYGDLANTDRRGGI